MSNNPGERVSMAGGTPLSTIIQQKSLTDSQCISLFLEICKALQSANADGKPHGALNPDSILIEKTGNELKVNIAVPGPARTPGANDAPGSEGAEFQEADQWQGTPDDEADVYALGLAMFEMLTGRPPFEETTTKSFLDKRLSQAAPDPRHFNKNISDSLAAILIKMLERGYKSLSELESDLTRLKEGKQIRSGQPVVTGKMLLIGLLVALPILICFALPHWNMAQLRNQAISAVENDKLADAISAYDALVRAQPDLIDNWHDYTNTLMDANEYSKVVLASKDGLKQFPRDGVLWVRLSNAYYYLSKYTEAEDAAKKALELNPKDSDALICLTVLFEEQNKPVEALSYAKKAVEVDPKSGSTLATLCELYYKTGNLADAENIAKKALAADPKNSTSNLTMAKILDQTGRKNDAAKYYQAALGSNPTHDVAKLAKDRLNSLLPGQSKGSHSGKKKK